MRNKAFDQRLGAVFSLPPSKIEGALKQLVKKTLSEKDHAHAHEASFHLAAFYYENDKIAKAKRTLLPIVTNCVNFPFIPRYANMFMLLGVIELGEENFTLASYYFRTGLKLARTHRLGRVICLAYSNLAIVSSALGRNEEALKLLLQAEKYIDHAPIDQHVLIYLNLAVCHKFLGHLAESEVSLNRCIDEFRGLESGRRALIQCCAMDLYYKQGNEARYEEYKQQIIREGAEKPTPDRIQAYQMICENAFQTQDSELAALMLSRLKRCINGREDMATQYFIVQQEGKLAKQRGDQAAYIEALETQLALKNKITELNSQRLIKSTGIELRLSQLMRQHESAKREQEKERKRRQVLAEALDMAREANAAKSEFLSRMSHDIRTPMNAILGFAELGKQDADDRALLLGDLDRISSAGEFLLGLVNDVLDMTKIESHAMELKPQPYTMAAFKQQITTLVDPLCANKQITFSFEQRNACPECLEVDRLRFNQVFFNLLSNAVKFTPERGHITMTAEVLHEDAETALLRFVVKDDGIGMSEDFQTRMFEAFSQEQAHITGREGTGLGLAIVKSIVSMMGGTIAVDSRLGDGTTFTVELPCKLGTVPALVETKPVVDPAEGLKGRRVLLCEDHPINRQLAIRLLEKVGITVTSATNGKEGLDCFDAAAPDTFDAVLMDIRMPVMDGIEATRAIRALDRPDAKHIPIIAMTANAFEADVQNCLSAGMTGHLAKPFQVTLLYTMLSEQIAGAAR